jgi:hypothetical protein
MGMENSEVISPREEQMLEKMREIIELAPARIEAEVEGTKCNWVAAYVNKLGALDMAIHSIVFHEPDTAPRYEEMQNKLAELTTRSRDLMRTYSSYTTPPPQEIKEELIEALNILQDF